MDDRRDGIRGLAFAMKNVAQLLLMCDQRDVGLSVNAGDEVTPEAVAGQDAPRIFIYDAYPGGIGFSAPLYGMHDELLARTRALIAGLRLRERLSDLRRADRRDRAAGQDRGAPAAAAPGARRAAPAACPTEILVPF